MHHLTYFNFSTIEHHIQSVENVVAYTWHAYSLVVSNLGIPTCGWAI